MNKLTEFFEKNEVDEDGDRQLALTLESSLRLYIRESLENAYTVWSALVNVTWHKELTNGQRIEGRFSFRGAGNLLAAIRNDGTDYKKYYCSGPYETVTPFIARTMKEQGWEYTPDNPKEPKAPMDADSGEWA
jgi:hypothetical protein